MRLIGHDDLKCDFFYPWTCATFTFRDIIHVAGRVVIYSNTVGPLNMGISFKLVHVTHTTYHSYNDR